MRLATLHHEFEPPIETTLVKLLQTNASAIGDKEAFCFVRGYGSDKASITYRRLHERAMAIGGELQSSMSAGTSASLLFPPGLEFIEATPCCIITAILSTDGGRVNFLSAIAAFYVVGAGFRWECLLGETGRRVRVPTYPCQRQQFWAPRKNSVADKPGRLSASRPPSHVESSEASGVMATTVRRRPDLTTPDVAPRTPLQPALVELWGSILWIEGVGIHDNFFRLRGNSLQATILINDMQDCFGEAAPAHALFEVQSIGDLVKYLRCHFAVAARRKFPDEMVASQDQPIPSIDSFDARVLRRAIGSDGAAVVGDSIP